MRTDVCVVGGGPAGAVTAQRLAELGHSVQLVERGGSRTGPPTESLTPAIWPLLGTLRRPPALDALALRRERMVVHWGAGDELPADGAGDAALVVNRAAFDAALRAAARNAGVVVLEPAEAREMKRDPGGGWQLSVTSRRETRRLHAAFLVDAAGRRGILAGPKRRHAVATLALCAEWRDVPQPMRGMRVEAGQDCWYWGAPASDGAVATQTFIDAARYVRRSVDALHLELLQRSQLLRQCLAGAPSAKAAVLNATAQCDAVQAGRDFIKVGEASLSLDPLSSQGVQTAIASALQAAVVVHTVLTKPDRADAAIDLYRRRQQAIFVRHRSAAQQVYARQSRFEHEFWRRRADSRGGEHDAAGVRPSTFDRAQRVSISSRCSYAFVPAVVGDEIALVRAVVHPALPEPLGFLAGRPAADFTETVIAGETAEHLIRRWTSLAPAATASAVAALLWSYGILVRYDA